MRRYEQFAFLLSIACAFILLLNLIGVRELNGLMNTILTAVTIASIATINIRKSKFIGIILYAISTFMILIYLAEYLS